MFQTAETLEQVLVGLAQRVVHLWRYPSVFSSENNISCLTYANFNVTITLLNKSHAFRAFWYELRLGDYIACVIPVLAGGLQLGQAMLKIVCAKVANGLYI
jgi:hypothetical protein